MLGVQLPGRLHDEAGRRQHPGERRWHMLRQRRRPCNRLWYLYGHDIYSYGLYSNGDDKAGLAIASWCLYSYGLQGYGDDDAGLVIAYGTVSAAFGEGVVVCPVPYPVL